jgi:hypothetical protein
MWKLAILAVLSVTLTGCSALEKACVGNVLRPGIPVPTAPAMPGPQAVAFLEK